MRIAPLAGAAAILLAGYAGMASAQTPETQASETHLLTLRLPNGQLEQVRYTGNVPPTVILSPVGAVADLAPTGFDSGLPFSAMDQMVAAMDRQAAAMIRTINAMTGPNGAGFGVMPVLAGPGVCMRSVQITYTGNGQPNVVSHTAGDCGSASGATGPAALPAVPAPRQSPQVTEAKAANPKQSSLRLASDQ